MIWTFLLEILQSIGAASGLAVGGWLVVKEVRRRAWLSVLTGKAYRWR